MTAKPIPKVCRAAPAVDMGPNYKLVCRDDYPVPEPGPGELLVELAYSGVCQSDHHFVLGDWKMLPVDGVDCTGHEGAGHVVKLGPGVTKFKVGDKVGITPIATTCGTCEYCLDGYETLCLNSTHVAVHTQGTYLQFTTISEDWAIALPENVDMAQLAPFMCSGGTAFTAASATECKKGDTVVVFGGGGGVGHMVVQFCKAMGFKVIAVDLGADKKKVAEEAGADAFIDVTTVKPEDLPAEVQKLTPGNLGAHATIVAAGNAKAYAAAPGVLRPRGVVIALGLPPLGVATLGGEPALAVFKGLRFRGILVSTRAQMAAALEYLKDGKVKEHITVYPFSEFPAALKRCAEGKANGRQVIDFNK